MVYVVKPEVLQLLPEARLESGVLQGRFRQLQLPQFSCRSRIGGGEGRGDLFAALTLSCEKRSSAPCKITFSRLMRRLR